MMKKLLSLFLAAVMLLTMLPSVLPQVGAEPAPSAKAVEAVKESRPEAVPEAAKEKNPVADLPEIVREKTPETVTAEERLEALRSKAGGNQSLVLNQEMEIRIDEEGSAVVMEYTPTTTRWYALTASGSLDTVCQVVDEDDNYIAWSDDYNGMNFCVKAELQAGTKYLFQMWIYGGGTGTFSVLLTEYERVTSGECGVNLTWNFDVSSGTLTVTGDGPMYNFSYEENPWYEVREEIVKVVLPEGLTRIGSSAFSRCWYLESVVMPTTLGVIGEYAFYNCSSLTKLDIPKNVRVIQGGAFYYCMSLTEFSVAKDNACFSGRDGVLFNKDGTELITCPGGKQGAYAIPAGVEYIDMTAFFGCYDLAAVSFPEGLRSIGDSAFFDCDSLTSVSLPDSVEEIMSRAFDNCSSLTYVRLPKGLEEVPVECFYNCYSLTTVELPENLVEISNSAFGFCSSLQEMTIPASVQQIQSFAFGNCSNLTKLVVLSRTCLIENSEYTLGEQDTTTIYGAVESSAESYADSFGFNFVAIDLCGYNAHNYVLDSEREHTNTAAGWKRWVCAECGYSYRETIPAGHIFTCAESSNLWYGTMKCIYCSESREGDTSVELVPDTKYRAVILEGAGAAWLRFTPEETGLYELKSFGVWDTYCELFDSYGYYVNENDDGAVNYNFNLVQELEAGETYYYRVKFLNEGAGSFDVMLTKTEEQLSGVCGADLTWHFDQETCVLTIEGSGWMDDYAWDDVPWYQWRPQIMTIVLPDGLKNIGECAFMDCYMLQKMLLPASIVYIGSVAFYNCSSLTKVTLPQSLKYLGSSAFSWCTSLNTVIMQKKLEKIDAYAFWQCPCLKEVTVPAAVQIIGPLSLGLTETYDEEYEDWQVIPVEGFTIRGYLNTEAQTYANENNLTFIPLQEFSDVTASKWYYDAVLWAVGHNPQITSGTGEGQFSPNNTCTRAQVMTFLWHAEGDPEPASRENPFEDVIAGKWYANAVLWAFHHDPQITTGATETSFGINDPCTRAQVVTFLWKAAGAPEPKTTENPFTDVREGKWYYKAVLWAVENGITSGMSADTFGTNETCTRAQVVTFLFKADQIK